MIVTPPEIKTVIPLDGEKFNAEFKNYKDNESLETYKAKVWIKRFYAGEEQTKLQLAIENVSYKPQLNS